MAIGLFDVEGGAAIHPTYQLTAPLFDRVRIALNPDYFTGQDFIIVTKRSSNTNYYIHSAQLNGSELPAEVISHDDLVQGGTLQVTLGSQPGRLLPKEPTEQE
jgi:putative alpha-1,2-mannosidase